LVKTELLISEHCLKDIVVLESVAEDGDRIEPVMY